MVGGSGSQAVTRAGWANHMNEETRPLSCHEVVGEEDAAHEVVGEEDAQCG